MPENKRVIKSSDLFSDNSQPETQKARVFSSGQLFGEERPVLQDPDKVHMGGLITDPTPEDVKNAPYAVYKAARSVPIFGELAAKGADYLIAAVDPNRNVDQVRAERLSKEQTYDSRFPKMSTVAGIAGAAAPIVPPIGILKAEPFIGEIATQSPKIAKFLTGAAETAGIATREGLIAKGDAELRGLDGDKIGQSTAKTAAEIVAASKILPPIGRGFAKYGLGVRDPERIAEQYVLRKPMVNAANEENLVDQVVASSDRFNSANKKADEAVDIARKEYAAAKEALRAEIKGTRPPETLANDVIASVDKLADRVSEGSSKAFDILAQSNVEIPLPKIKAFLTSKLNRYKFNNTHLPEAQADAAVLQQWRQFFDDVGDKTARPEDMKQIIQYIDQKTKPIYAKRVDERTLAERDILDFRKYLDSFLKEDVPGYADAMKSVATDAKLLSESRKMFDGELRTDRTLERIGKPFKEKELKVLKDLSSATGTDLVTPMQEYMSAQRSTSGPSFSQKAESLPEFGQMKNIEAARDMLSEKTQFAKRFSRENAQSQLKRMRSSTQDPIMLRRDLEELSKQTGVDFIQLNKDLAMKEAFERGFANGSSNVNLQAISAQALASALFKGAEKLPLVGAALGAVGGKVIDKSGPAIYKAYLDLSMTPLYQKSAAAILKAAEKGPQISAQIQKRELENNPEFRDAVVAHLQGQAESDKQQKRRPAAFELPSKVGFSIPEQGR